MIKYYLLLLSIIPILFSCTQDKKIIDTKHNPEFWIWWTVKEKYPEKDIKKAIKKISETGINNILVNSNKIQLEKIITEADKYNINVHAWFITMNSKEIGKNNPEWLSVNKLGKSLDEEKAYVDHYKFVCPAIPEVRQFIKNKIEDICKIEGLKGIHMDYIRYVDVLLPIGLQPKYDIVQDKVYPEFDYGYHPFMRNKYKQEFGVDPIDIQNPEDDKQWNQFRLNQVTEFVFQVDTLVNKYNKTLTAAVFPSPEMSKVMVYQDWGKWPLDIAFPMLYNGFYNKDINWIGEMVNEGNIHSQEKTNIVSGIFAPDLTEGDDFINAIDISLKSGAIGVSVFGLNPLSDDERWEKLKVFIFKLNN